MKIHIHPTAMTPAAIFALQLLTGRIAVISGHGVQLVERKSGKPANSQEQR